MPDKPQLGLAQVQAAMTAMIKEASKEPDRPLAFAIVDDHGSLLSYAHMDGCPLIPKQIAPKKAYTSAGMGVDSGAFGEMLKSGGMSATDLADPNVVGMQGGLAIVHNGAILGGIGVSGRLSQEDEDVARAGLKALNL